MTDEARFEVDSFAIVLEANEFIGVVLSNGQSAKNTNGITYIEARVVASLGWIEVPHIVSVGGTVGRDGGISWQLPKSILDTGASVCFDEIDVGVVDLVLNPGDDASHLGVDVYRNAGVR